VSAKVPESAEITSFYLEPVDGGPVIAHKPGQYIGVRLNVNGAEVRRNYSLSAASSGTGLRISVKREPGGVVSNFLHDEISVGTVLELFPPSGAFTLSDSSKPLVLISGGVGITPTLAMAEAALSEGNREVVFIHYARNAKAQAFQAVLNDWRQRYPLFQAHVVHEEQSADSLQRASAIGRPALGHLAQWLPADKDVDAYFLGPKPFMAFMKRSLEELGVPEAQTHYEFFGPAQALA
jgi:nitric oxide dioxygenase